MWLSHLNEFFTWLNDEMAVPFDPPTEDKLKAAGYNKLFITVPSIYTRYQQSGRVDLPPMFNNPLRDREVNVFYNNYLAQRLLNSGFSGTSRVVAGQIQPKEKTKIKTESLNSKEILLTHQRNKKFLSNSFTKWKNVCKEDLPSQILTRMTHLANLYLTERKLKLNGNSKVETFSQSFIIDYFLIPRTTFKNFQGCFILFAISPQKAESLLKKLLKNNTVSSTLGPIKRESLDLLKIEWPKVKKNSAADEMKCIISKIFLDFLKHHSLT